MKTSQKYNSNYPNYDLKIRKYKKIFSLLSNLLLTTYMLYNCCMYIMTLKSHIDFILYLKLICLSYQSSKVFHWTSTFPAWKRGSQFMACNSGCDLNSRIRLHFMVFKVCLTVMRCRSSRTAQQMNYSCNRSQRRKLHIKDIHYIFFQSAFFK